MMITNLLIFLSFILCAFLLKLYSDDDLPI